MKKDKVVKMSSLGLTIVAVIIGAIIAILGYVSRSPTITEIGAMETRIPITTTEWHHEVRDPEKESMDFGLKEKGLKYYIVVDQDFNHPKLLPSVEYVDLGRNAHSYHICLMPGQGVEKATLIVSRKR